MNDLPQYTFSFSALNCEADKKERVRIAVLKACQHLDSEAPMPLQWVAVGLLLVTSLIIVL